jgi:flagellar basal-body rod protein FlgF
MSDVISLSSAGMINSLQRLTLISHNLANANTNGYRRDIAVTEPFEMRLARITNESGSLLSSRHQEKLAPHTRSVLDVATGSLRHTGNALNFAIEGDGFFEFSGNDGLYYSRRGVFTQDATGQLMTANGRIVEGLSGPLRLSDSEPHVDQDGVIWIDDQNIGQLKIVQFDDASKLEKVGENYFQLGRAKPMESSVHPKVRQGYIEGSNVDVMSEMVSMMTVMRHLETTQRVVTSYDDIIGTAIETIGEF